MTITPRTMPLAVLAALIAILSLTSAARSIPQRVSEDGAPSSAQQQQRRAAAPTTKFSVPNGYSLLWTSSGTRAKIGSVAVGYISMSPESGSQITQSSINSCTAKCSASSSCVDVQLVQYTGGTGAADVYCNLYSTVKSKTEATYKTRKNKSGSVVVAYNYGREASASSKTSSTSAKLASSQPAKSSTTTSRAVSSTTKVSSSTKTTPTSTKSTSSASVTTVHSTITSGKTTTTTTSTSTASTTTTTLVIPPRSDLSSDGPRPRRNPPANPKGAILYQYRPTECAGTSGYVPIFANRHWVNSTHPVSSATRAYVVQHGAGRDFENAFAAISSNVDQSSSLVVTPNFYLPSDKPTYKNASQSNWFEPEINLAWSSSNAWIGGSDAVAGSASNYTVGACSTYEVWDSLVTLLNNKSKYPSLEVIYLVGHSAGASLMHHYAVVSDKATGGSGVPIKWVAFNAASLPYFESHRPDSYENCSGYDSYLYGYASSLPRYVASHGGSSPLTLFKRYIGLNLYSGTGTTDIRRLYDFGDDSCSVLAQGGLNRRDRNYAWWAYRNLLAGTSTNVTAYYGAKNLTESGLKAIGAGNGFGHRDCVVLNVGHVDAKMYASECGQYALGQTSTKPKEQEPVRPE